jgi:hypothetical protein
VYSFIEAPFLFAAAWNYFHIKRIAAGPRVNRLGFLFASVRGISSTGELKIMAGHKIY